MGELLLQNGGRAILVLSDCLIALLACNGGLAFELVAEVDA
jgi:hypothetical protein